MYARIILNPIPRCLSLVVGALFSVLCWAGNEVQPSQAITAEPIKGQKLFASIDDVDITQQQFDVIFAGAVRNKFYHGRIPEKDLLSFRKKVAVDIINQTLLYRYARKTGMQPNARTIKSGMEGYEKRFRNAAETSESKDEIIKQMVSLLERRDLLMQLEQKIKNIPEAEMAKVKRFYKDNLDKFTEPKREKVAMILLPVAPSAKGDEWTQAGIQAQELYDLIKAGADFAKFAKEYSADPSAAEGGGLGYIHGGMLSTEVQKALNNIKVGEVTLPVETLKGMAIFKLQDRIVPKPRAFELVSIRAQQLHHRQQQDRTWQAFIDQLRTTSETVIYDEFYRQQTETPEKDPKK